MPFLQGGGRLTGEPGIVVGTPGYMAPEQVRAAGDLGPRADLFALGCVLWECIAGRQLFLGDKPLAVVLRVLLETPPRLREVALGVPEPVDDLVARLLSKDPAGRPANGAELVGFSSTSSAAAPSHGRAGRCRRASCES